MLDDKNFCHDSRQIQMGKESYYDSKSTPTIENIAIIEIDIWDNFNNQQKESLCNIITNFFIRDFGLAGDNILILIREMCPMNWTQNGINGGQENFLKKSRLL